MLSMEKDASEVTWSFGTYLEPAKVRDAFGLPALPREPVGVGACQPWPLAQGARTTYAWTPLALAAIVLVFLGFAITGGRAVHTESFAIAQTAVPASPEAAVFTQRFFVERSGNLEVRVDAPVDNSWLYLDGALINEETGEVDEFDAEVEYYHGTDSDSGPSGSPARTQAASQSACGAACPGSTRRCSRGSRSAPGPCSWPGGTSVSKAAAGPRATTPCSRANSDEARLSRLPGAGPRPVRHRDLERLGGGWGPPGARPGERPPVSRRLALVRLLERRQVMEQWIANHVRGIVDSLIYSALGIVILVAFFWCVQRLLPFSVKKEIEEDQNVSLGIILAAFIIGISMIIAAVLRS
jgi:hypothetical protein